MDSSRKVVVAPRLRGQLEEIARLRSHAAHGAAVPPAEDLRRLISAVEELTTDWEIATA
jgi:hypothetical protein